MFRRLPPICLFVALTRMIAGTLTLSKQFVGVHIKAENGKVFRIFRNIKIRKEEVYEENIVFVVSFKFARLSHHANKIASIIPMLLIAGFPGFIQKVYAVDPESGYWQGMYQWKSSDYLEKYKRSFVFKMMNKRALNESISLHETENLQLDKLIVSNLVGNVG